MTSNATRLELFVGPLSVALDGLPPDVCSELRGRYRLFLQPPVPTEAALQIKLNCLEGTDHRPEGVPEITTPGSDHYHVVYGSVRGELDLSSGKGTFELSPSYYTVDSLFRIATSLLALRRQAILLHASAVAVDGKALVCFGPSGAGKTTVARCVDPSNVLCDELNLLWRDGDGRVWVSGSPFHGDLAVCSPQTLSLLALVSLRQSDHDQLQRLGPAASLRYLLACVLFFSTDTASVTRMMETVEAICQGSALELHFTLNVHVPSFVQDALRVGSV